MSETIKLSEEQLYQCLKSLNVPVRLNDLKTPTKDFMIRVFECFLKDLHIDLRDRRLMLESELTLECPETSEDARMLTVLLMIINFFTHEDGLVIKLKDITEPKPKRTKKILHYLLVLWKYCLTKYALIQSIEEGFQDEKERIACVMAENQSLEEQCEECAHRLKQMDPDKELQQIVASKNDKINEFCKKKEADALEYQNWKTEEQDLRNKIAAAEMNIIAIKETISELDQCILTSPERFTTEISKLKDAIKTEELKIKEKDLDFKEKIKMLEGLKLAQDENVKAVELLQKIENTYAELSNTASIYVQNSQKTKHQEETIENLTEEFRKKKENKYSYEEGFVQTQLNTNKQIEAFTDALQALQKNVTEEKELLAVSKTSTSDFMSKIDKEADNVLEVVELCQQAEEKTTMEHVAYSAQMQAISTQFRNDCKEVKSQVNSFFNSQP